MTPRARRRSAALALAFALTGCGRRDDGPLRAVVIGSDPKIVDANIRPPRPEDAMLMNAAAEGLVRVDAAGQIVPGLAIRWSVSDDGLSYIFRLGDRRWLAGQNAGTKVTAAYVARRLRAASAPNSRNPLASILTGIEEIVATTEDVFEIRLTAPRPNLLYHLARPELAIVRDGRGAGPFAIEQDEHEHLRLTRTVPLAEGERTQMVLLDAARPALAVALFAQSGADVVLGGTLADLPIVRAAEPSAAALRFDPALGLLGLAVVDAGGLLGRLEVRRALSMAIDRDALVAAFDVPGLTPRAALTPPGLSNLPSPAAPDWDDTALPLRQAEARRLIGTVVATPVAIRVAMPDGLGYRLLFARLKHDWALVGIAAVRVAVQVDADLRLVDAVAPSRGASWFLERFACARAALCDEAADAAITAARVATDATERTRLFAEADRRLVDAHLFIPLTSPVRWSLVARRVAGYRPNSLAVHGLVDMLGDAGD